MTQHANATPNPCTHPASKLLEAVAFGFATEEERAEVMAHIATCPECAAALEHAKFAADVLPLSVDETSVELPDRIWAGIEQRIAAESEPQIASAPVSLASPQPPAPYRVHWAVAALLAVLTLAAGMLLGRTVFEQERDEPTPAVVEATVTNPEIQAHGTVEYLPEQGVLLLQMEDMAPAPEGQVYQVWVIDGDTPVSAGILDPTAPAFATTADPSRFQTLAVTLEQGPTGTDQPTTDPIVVVDLTTLPGD